MYRKKKSEKITKEVKKLNEFEGCEITFHGGETTDRPLISHMISELKKEAHYDRNIVKALSAH